ncbi:MAG: ATP-binding protein [Candidatus Wallbacteria bacterium]
MEFKKATKTESRLRIAISGAAGSGKTYSALQIAKGIGGGIAVIDTERGSASLYAGIFNFDVLNIEPPYSPEKYIEAISVAEKSGYSVVIIDSLSHAWAGSGGLLDLHDTIQKSAKGGNSFSAWKEVTPLQNKFIDAIVCSKCHIIATMRAKQDYVIENNNGRNQVRKVGLAPVQREGVEYEFSVYIELSQEHIAIATKDRTNLFDGKCFVPNEQTGVMLKEWLNNSNIQITNSNTVQAPAMTEHAKNEPSPDLSKITKEPTIQQIAGILKPELKALFSRLRVPTSDIISLWRTYNGQQEKIIEVLAANVTQAARQVAA